MDAGQIKRLNSANVLLQDALRSLDSTAKDVKKYIENLKSENILSQQAFFILKNHRRLAGEFEYVTAVLQGVEHKCGMIVQLHTEFVHILKEVMDED